MRVEKSTEYASRMLIWLGRRQTERAKEAVCAEGWNRGFFITDSVVEASNFS